MNNRLRNKLNNAVELTSLLDVIFIVLMVVVCFQKLNIDTKAKEADAYMEQASEMVDEADKAITDMEVYKEQLDTYENLFDQMTVINIRVDYTPSDIKNREIKVIVNNEESKFTLTPDNSESAYGKLEKLLGEKLEGSKDIPVIIEVNEDHILYRDLMTVNEMVDTFAENNSNIFMKVQKAESDD